MSSGFRSSVWDPLLILSQIVCMQCIFYVSAGVWVGLLDVFFGFNPTLSHLFSYTDIKTKDSQGRLLLAAFLLSSLTASLGLWLVVKRTKQCLDFTCSLHIYHLVFCWLYNARFPYTFAWWLVNIISTILMTVMGEFLCMRSELKAIPLGPKANL